MMEGRADPEGLPWYARRQGWIQRVYHGMMEGRGGSRGFTLACCKAEADSNHMPLYSGDPEGVPW